MKNIIFLLCCIFYMSALGQSHFVEDTPEVRNWLDNMFQHLDKSKIPHGLLRDYAFELADLDIYNGKELNDSNYVDRVAFENHLVSVITLWIAHLGEFTLPNSMIGVVYVPIVINIVDKHLTGSVAIKHRRYLFCQTPFTSLSKTCSFS